MKRTGVPPSVILPLVVVFLLAACGSSEPTLSSTAIASPTSTTSTTEPPTTTTTAAPVENMAAYFVGNSLTNGTLNWFKDDIRGLVVLIRQVDQLVRPLGWHIKCGASLVSIAQNPNETCVDPAIDSGTFPEALPQGDWDFLVVQPYPGEDSTLETDITVITDLANMVSSDTAVAVFTGWPKIDGFIESWNAGGPVSDDTATQHSRIYFDTLVDRLDDLLDQDVLLIPTGEVLYRIAPELASGAVPGMAELADLYADDVHLGQPGNWLSGVTAASVMTGADPTGFSKPYQPTYGPNSEFSGEYVRLVQRIVTEVLSE